MQSPVANRRFNLSGTGSVANLLRARGTRTTDLLQKRWNQHSEALLRVRRRVNFAGRC